MRDEAFDSDPGGEWNPVALYGGAASLRVPANWQPISRDDGGLAFQSPGSHPVDLLVSVTTYRNPYGVRTEEAIQYLDRENVLPPGILPSEDEGDEEEEGHEDRRWIAYAVAQPPDRQVFVWKVADFQPPDHVHVVTLQLHVPALSAAQPDLAALIDRLGEEAARVRFHPTSLPGPVQRVTMRNVAHRDQVRFRLPWDWHSRTEDELTIFSREEPGYGSLRVAVHSFVHEGEDAELLAQAVLRQTAEQFAQGPDGRQGKGDMEWLGEGDALARFVTDGEEEGEPLRFFLWLRGSAVDGHTTVALFSFAFPQASLGGERETTLLAMLEREIRKAVVGPAEDTEMEDDALLAQIDGFSLSDLLSPAGDDMEGNPFEDGDDPFDGLDEDEDEDEDDEEEPEDDGGPFGNA
ncbi:hypothetical protein [Niveispirillum irakense]|uniref:hypothetical protein n=1 Tax=Niveispirillum irakense TaxID=34011 RepID=UPI0004208006|nr:hypothetical protein [Niveispirillum irakense]